MHDYPPHFRADLRAPEPLWSHDPSPWFQWRTRALIELAAARSARFLLEAVKGKRRVLEVGCGTGFVALELAREGHAVMAIDPSEKALEVARRTLGAEAVDLAYVQAPFEAFSEAPGTFDAVVFNRSLHHVTDLDGSVEKVRELLRKDGVIACNEFAFDRFDERAATWVFAIEQLLSAGASELEATCVAEAIRELRDAWTTKYREHGLHAEAPMLGALDARFQRRGFSREPYLYVRLANRVVDRERAEAMARFLFEVERYAIDHGALSGLGFRYVGAR
jgi:2-polyprenyl-3-methyl-5-hydroxy-6-metoxy-1,4-benzoquinol methylase